jgi:hypothetical protein
MLALTHRGVEGSVAGYGQLQKLALQFVPTGEVSFRHYDLRGDHLLVEIETVDRQTECQNWRAECELV